MEMKLTYITIHTMEPEIMKDFYIKYLGAVVDDARPFDRDGSGKDNRVASPSSYGTVYSLSFDGGGSPSEQAAGNVSTNAPAN